MKRAFFLFVFVLLVLTTASCGGINLPGSADDAPVEAIAPGLESGQGGGTADEAESEDAAFEATLAAALTSVAPATGGEPTATMIPSGDATSSEVVTWGGIQLTKGEVQTRLTRAGYDGLWDYVSPEDRVIFGGSTPTTADVATKVATEFGGTLWAVYDPDPATAGLECGVRGATLPAGSVLLRYEVYSSGDLLPQSATCVVTP